MNNNIDEHWKNPDNWKWHLIYRCKQDPRLVVPERYRWMGFTLNFGHRTSYLLALSVLLILVVPSLDAIRDGRIQDLPLTLAFSALLSFFLFFTVSRVGRH